uniref:Uncharacterized protein n=1 Tax=Grammatophora oceanica TaxID=210454 RepID=A0A7S1UR99_9STRA
MTSKKKSSSKLIDYTKQRRNDLHGQDGTTTIPRLKSQRPLQLTNERKPSTSSLSDGDHDVRFIHHLVTKLSRGDSSTEVGKETKEEDIRTAASEEARKGIVGSILYQEENRPQLRRSSSGAIAA